MSQDLTVLRCPRWLSRVASSCCCWPGPPLGRSSEGPGSPPQGLCLRLGLLVAWWLGHKEQEELRPGLGIPRASLVHYH